MSRQLATSQDIMDLLGIDYRKDIITAVRIDLLPDELPTVTVWKRLELFSGEEEQTYNIQLTPKN